MTEDRFAHVADHFGKVVRDAWIKWAKEQPDITEHPHWLTEWQDLPERDREVDRRIAFEVFAETTLFLREREVTYVRRDPPTPDPRLDATHYS